MGKRLQTVAAMACMKTFLMIFNISFWASGLAILCSGIWFQAKLHKYLELNPEYSDSIPYVLVGLGAFILFVGTLGCCCTVKGQPSLLYLYGAVLSLILLIEVTAAVSIYAFKGHLADGFDKGLNRTMISYGITPRLTDDFDLMQSELHCCGNHGYLDWNNLNPPRPVPRSCCKIKNCDVEQDALYEIYTQGCYDKIVDFISKNISIIGGCVLGVALFPILGIFLSCVLASNISKAKYEQMA